VKIDCTLISDLHGFKPELPGGDLLIVAGDLTARDEPDEYIYFRDWLVKQNYRRRIVIAGNHDNKLELDYTFGATLFLEIADYLCDSGTEFEGLKIWGSPWSHRFIGMYPKCTAFTYFDETWYYDKILSKIPHDTDILVTHTPAYGILDKTFDGRHVGSTSLRKCFFRVRPRLHVCGHIHEQGGRTVDLVTSKVVNASYVNEHYKPVNKPVRIVL
jgi:Icc-related predicted phosphoesterase